MESPVKSLINKLNTRIDGCSVSFGLASVIKIASPLQHDIFDVLVENGVFFNERVEMFMRDYLSLNEIIIKANHKAHSILNPNIKLDSIDKQYKKFLKGKEVKKLKKLFPESEIWKEEEKFQEKK